MAQVRRKRKVGEILISQGYINQEQLDKALTEHYATGISIGTILVKMGFIDEETLSMVLGKQIEYSQRKRIGEVLVDQGYLSSEQIEEGLKQQKVLGLQLGKCLVQLGYIEESKLLDVLAAQLDLQHVVLENYKFDAKIIKLISEEMARSYKAIALYEKSGSLTVAMADPTNLRSLDHLKFKTGKDIEPVIATEREIQEAIEKVYADNQAELSSLLDDEQADGEGGDLVLLQEGPEEEDNQYTDEEGRQVKKIVNLIVTEAIRQGASDIHLEPQEGNMRVRFRVDGELTEINPIPSRLMSQVTSRLKILSGMDIAEKRRPLDGRFTIRFKGREVDLRCSTFPTFLRRRGVSEKMVMRILDPNAKVMGLDDMGFSATMLPQMKRLLENPDGIVLVTGPTGSGKSSTLYACVNQIMDPSINIVTMEDPVEMNLPGISQGQINNPAGFTFAAGIRAILRQDPDVIMLGEMRDLETAEMAIQASLTGHLVFSTLHTNDASGAFTRLLDMGLEPFLVSSTVKGVLAQRLVRRICSKCREQMEVPDLVLERIGIRPGTPFYQGAGCSSCNNTGYKGRMAVFELLMPNEEVQAMIMERKPSDEIKTYSIRNQAMATLRRDGLEKALAGLTTIEQVVAVSQPEM